MASNGLKETINYSFIDKESAEIFCDDKDLVMLSNSISKEMDKSKAIFDSGLLDVVKNQARGLNDIAIFEIGQIFYGSRTWRRNTRIKWCVYWLQ